MKAWLGTCACLALTALATSCPQASLSQGIVVTRPAALVPSATLPLPDPVSLSIVGSFPITEPSSFTATITYGFQEAGDTYSWYLNGEALVGSGQAITLVAGLDPLTSAGRYTLSGVMRHEGFSYAVDWVFEVQ